MAPRRINLSRLHANFQRCVAGFLDKRKITQKELARDLGLQESVLSELMLNHPRRPLTAHYLELFLKKGICSMQEICDGRPRSENELEFWAGIAENEEWMAMLGEAKRKNVDVKKMVRSILDNFPEPQKD